VFHGRQRKTARHAFALCLVVLGAQLASAGTAQALDGAIRDGRDTKGALDISGVSYASVGSTVTQTVRFHAPVASRSLKVPHATLVFAFDSNNDFRADMLAVVVYADHALRTVLANSHGKILDVSRAQRPDSRTIAVTFPSRVFRQGGYRWTVLTVYKDRAHCRRGCVDTAPNRVPALFDFTPPIANLAVPDPYNLLSTTTDFTVQVQVADRGFSGVRRWALETHPAGSADWSTIAAGSAASIVDVPRVGSEGATYEFRLTAVDAQGNVTTTTRLVSVPIDDANPLLAGAYTGGSWDTLATPGQRLFQNTVHRGFGSDVAFTYSFTGTYFAWLGPGSCCAGAHVSIDGGSPQGVDSNAYRLFEQADMPYGTHTVAITPGGNGSVLEIDAIVTR
jgi:hypothetical protein